MCRKGGSSNWSTTCLVYCYTVPFKRAIKYNTEKILGHPMKLMCSQTPAAPNGALAAPELTTNPSFKNKERRLQFSSTRFNSLRCVRAEKLTPRFANIWLKKVKSPFASQLATQLTTWLTTLAGPFFFVMQDQAIINMAMK